jgi:integrase
MKKITQYLIQWQLHTMVRGSEAVGAKWSEIDFENKLWNIPAERMKNKFTHSVPLTAQALSLLNAIKPISGYREYIFPADSDPRNHTNGQKLNAAIKKMGYKGNSITHDLRSLASTILNEQGFEHDVIRATLAHVDSNEVRRSYNRTDFYHSRRKLMNWWSNHIDKSLVNSLFISCSSVVTHEYFSVVELEYD